ncbi:MAG: LysM peptidoglycan-binding domain-containing protein [Bacteroidota bacterium]
MRNNNLSACIVLCAGILISDQLPAQEVHKVQMRETLSSIAHKYHVTVGDLMRYNGLNAKSKLQIGERIKIPSKNQLKETVKEDVKPAKKAEPVAEIKETKVVSSTEPAKTHIVAQGESLFRIAKNYKVPIAKLREWNNIQDYTITVGQELFISKPSEDEIKAMQPAKTSPVKIITEPTAVEKTTVKTVEEPKVEEKKSEPSVPVKPVVVSQQIKIADESKNLPVVDQPVKQPTVETSKIPVNKSKTVSATDQGFFASQFVSSQQELSGTAGVLKTSSGWLDKKYYVLMNNVAPGTIVKITVNNNIVYAKVLEALPDVKEDQGLLLRVSNAAASVLNITDSKFQVTVNY